jgi:hypothetical protein
MEKLKVLKRVQELWNIISPKAQNLLDKNSHRGGVNTSFYTLPTPHSTHSANLCPFFV